MTSKKIYLLDTFSFIYRAYFAFLKNPMVNSKGLNVSTIFGFTNLLIDIIQKENPDYIISAFDCKEPTFRHNIYTEYKSNRDGQPEIITASIPYIKNILSAFNIPILELPGFEADDIIGTLTKRYKKKGFEVYIFTPDKDFVQLLTENVYIYKPGYLTKDSEILDKEKVLKKWNLENIDQTIDIFGLWGDKIDNIPGIPGIGEKTAMRLINEFGSIENLIKNKEKLTEKLKAKITDFADQALQSKELVKIKTDVPLDYNIEDSKYRGIDKDKCLNIFSQLEFKKLSKKLFGVSIEEERVLSKSINNENIDIKNHNLVTYDHNYHLINSIEELEKLKRILINQNKIALTTNTSNSNPHKSLLLGISISYKKHNGYYISFEKSEIKNYAKEILNQILTSNILKIGMDLKKDIIILKRNQIDICGPYFDNTIAHYIVEPELRHDIKIMASMYLHYDTIDFSIDNKDSNKVKTYFLESSDIAFQLKEVLEQKLKIENAEKLFYDIEIPTLEILAIMELNGVKIDTKILSKLSITVYNELQTTENEIYKLAGCKFVINSPKQLGHILFDKLQIIDQPEKTKTGQYATGEPILSKLITLHPIIRLILNYKGLSKLKSTYIDALPKLISKEDGRIHTTYNQTIVATGRLSSTDPNLQNIPIRNEIGKKIREAFIPQNGEYLIMSVDYSQIELRIMASFAKEKNMIDAFTHDKDIHLMTASRLFNMKESEVTADMRAKAKTVNFGIIYGISGFGLSKLIEVTRSEAHQIIQNYFIEFPDIKTYTEKVTEEARELGYVKTLFGRKRILEGINSRNSTIRKLAERNAINSPIQGTQAEMIKIAMIKISNWMKHEKLRSKMIMQIHDELIFEIYKGEEEKMKKNVLHIMENAVKLLVPTKANIGVGKNWMEAH